VCARVLVEAIIGASALTLGGFALAKRQRAALYAGLRQRVAAFAPAGDLQELRARAAPAFAQRLAIIADALPAGAFAALRSEAQNLAGAERSFVPAHKKGGTIAYETLVAAAPAIVAAYHSAELCDLISRIVGTPVQPTPINDQSSLSVLFYDRPGDHIGWHYDHNFYRGRHFTVLITLENRGTAANGLSHAVLQARTGADDRKIATAPNTLVVFEGALVRHRVTPIKPGEHRLVLSMTYCTDPRARWWQGASRRIKDMAFFGLRALWT
jgi:hypothetical protein